MLQGLYGIEAKRPDARQIGVVGVDVIALAPGAFDQRQRDLALDRGPRRPLLLKRIRGQQIEVANRVPIGLFVGRFHSVFTQIFNQLVRIQRSGPVKALDRVAPDGSDELRLLLGFHALDERQYSQALGRLDDCRHQLAGFRRSVPHEHHVDFQQIEAIVLQHPQRGVAAAKVVDPNGVARALQGDEHLLQAVPLLQQNALGHFDLDRLAGHPMRIKCVVDCFAEAGLCEVQP